MWVNVGKSNQQIKKNNLTDTYQIVRAIISHFEFSQFDVCERVNFTCDSLRVPNLRTCDFIGHFPEVQVDGHGQKKLEKNMNLAKWNNISPI